MFPAKYLLLVAVVLPLSVLESSGDDVIPSKCGTLCQQPPPPSPPLSGYPSYGAPPPPSGYSIYSPPPPPPSEAAGQSKCPPAGAGAGVECCTPPATNAPPNPYAYVPYGEGQRSVRRLLLPILAPLIVLFSSLIFLF